MAELKPAREPVASENGKLTGIYKTTPQGDLKVYVYLPPGWTAGQKNPAIVMIHGGGFNWAFAEPVHRQGGIPGQPRNGSGGGPEYRLKTKPGVTVATAIEDGKSAIRWVRMNAKELSIDPDRIVGAGGSAGGTCEVFCRHVGAIRA